MSPANDRPSALSIRMFQVGFGDCFLLTFNYPGPLDDGRDVRHVLVDFGSMAFPWGYKTLQPVGREIAGVTGGEIDVIVASHRHRDHVSGFNARDVPSLGMKAGFPRLVVRSWTEDPALGRAATGPAAAGRAVRSPAVGRRSRAFVRSLRTAEAFADELARKLRGAASSSLPGELRVLAEDQTSNKEAVDRLRTWGDAGRPEYVHYGRPSGIEDVVPGIGVKVLGPPTVDQHPRVARQRTKDPKEFWMLYSSVLEGLLPRDLLLGRKGAADTFMDDVEDDPEARDPALDEDRSGSRGTSAARDAPDTARTFGDPGPVRWLTDRMMRQQVNSLLRVVRILDDVLNNTSLILLLEVPTGEGPTKPLRLLFGGDAQIENWEYALKVADDHDANLDLLRQVDVYKVGHHGSRNATPRTLFNLWQEPATEKRPMTALMSTKPGVHGKTTATKVPRKTLVAALDTRMTLRSTTDLARNVWCHHLRADLGAGRKVTDVPVQPTPPQRRGPERGVRASATPATRRR